MLLLVHLITNVETAPPGPATVAGSLRLPDNISAIDTIKFCSGLTITGKTTFGLEISHTRHK